MKGLVCERELLEGIQKLYRFDNNYGASVVRHPYSYGHETNMWELAVLTWDGDKSNLCYSSPITGDVVGYLSNNDVEDLLKKIKALPHYLKGENRGQT